MACATTTNLARPKPAKFRQEYIRRSSRREAIRIGWSRRHSEGAFPCRPCDIPFWPPRWPPSSPLPSTPNETVYLCYMPTVRTAAPPGVILYEVHVLARRPVPVPVPAPDRASERVRQVTRGTPQTVEARARQFLADNPDIAGWIRAIAVVLAAAAVIAAIVAVIDPVPGDEVAAAMLASTLFRIAMAR